MGHMLVVDRKAELLDKPTRDTLMKLIAIDLSVEVVLSATQPHSILNNTSQEPSVLPSTRFLR